MGPLVAGQHRAGYDNQMSAMEWLTLGLLLGTAALAVITGLYARSTARMAREIRNQSELLAITAQIQAHAALAAKGHGNATTVLEHLIRQLSERSPNVLRTNSKTPDK